MVVAAARPWQDAETNPVEWKEAADEAPTNYINRNEIHLIIPL